MAIPQRPTPIPVVVEGITVCEWPPTVPGESEARYALAELLLGTAYATYVDKAPFRRFDEGGIDLLRRLARSICEGRTIDPTKVVDQYLLHYGRPE